MQQIGVMEFAIKDYLIIPKILKKLIKIIEGRESNRIAKIVFAFNSLFPSE